MPQLAKSDNEIERCFDVMSELRTHLDKNEFLNTVRAIQEQGYQLAFIEGNGKVVAVAGFRISTNLFMGKHLYVDDLVTASSERSKGYGKILIMWLRNEAKKHNCQYLHLDSGTHRGQAHKFYFAQGLTIASYHFSEQLK